MLGDSCLGGNDCLSDEKDGGFDAESFAEAEDDEGDESGCTAV